MLSSRPIPINADIDAPHSILNAKTPGRKFKGRNALQENAIYSGSKTVLSKKSHIQTPFRPGTAHGKKPLVSVSVTRPLTDKTPFPNRVLAANYFGGAGPAGKTPGLKLSKLALLAPEPQQGSADVAPLLRPSSARKSLRGRLSGGNFKTPLTKGNYWDVSPGDMEGIAGVVQEGKQETEAAVNEDEDEIEYMPPPAVELSYEPPFELPDYKTIGRGLFNLGHGGLMDDTADVFYAAEIEQQIDVTRLLADTGFKPDSFDAGLELPELEDDSPFARTSTKPSPSPSSSAQPTRSAIPLPRAPSTRAAASSSSSRTQPSAPPRPATAIPGPSSRPQTRAVSSSSSRIALPVPGQTRTSALRAAKAASTSVASTTPNPVRPAAARPAAMGVRRPIASASNTTVAAQGRPIVRSATTGAVAAKDAGAGRTRLATVVGKATLKAGSSTAGGNARRPGNVAEEDGDALAAMLEREHAGGGVEDFVFDV
ncbi:hypothetical protein BD309DRAFT_1000406 [Dichomitus squalens]|uniref:Uncharacterized protein n=1 Tax=Dichomitus squalens TaxID=114155 RepID=A0A4Q9NT62_9APHY|nr:hypothetical protein BD311DRAFT_791043 [Dichomitus squalens]TBU44528.1 hypothetical protein BD309DRAFT_1000406 [Dichomitus squalens]